MGKNNIISKAQRNKAQQSFETVKAQRKMRNLVFLISEAQRKFHNQLLIQLKRNAILLWQNGIFAQVKAQLNFRN